MRFIPCEIPEVILVEPDVHGDERGFFIETYRETLFRKNGIRDRFVQDNHSSSRKGVLRGLHYQKAPFAQAKLVRAVRGEVFDVAVDIRPRSKTRGRAVCRVLSEKNQRMLYIPAGFAHGYLTLSERADVLYKVSAVYSPEHEAGLLWNDPALGIPWPKSPSRRVLSPKDRAYPAWGGTRR